MAAHQPVQILNFSFPLDSKGEKEKSIIILNEENLDRILKPVGDREICFISIAGPSRQGKSFLLSFMLRYLESLETENSDWMGWDQKNEPLRGFKWQNGIEPETAGMWIWDKPYIVNTNGKSVAILLMDTQGTFDAYTTEREWSAIVGLSLLTSSTLIFNFFKQLQEDVLEALNTYINYGLLAINNEDNDADESSAPFQKLIFLIRDWNTPTEHPYGEKGGRSFIKRKLEVKENQAREAREVRTQIKKCFQEIDCFLMPDPGEKAKGTEFDGAVSGLSTKFANKVESFINELLNPDNLVSKQVCGNTIKAGDLLNYFRQYVDVFNSESTPTPMSLWMATATITNQNIVKTAKSVYTAEMKKIMRSGYVSKDKLSSTHTKGMKKANAKFAETRPLGNAEMIKKFKDELQNLIKDEYAAYKETNDVKKNELKGEAMKTVLELYEVEMERRLKSEFFEDSKLKNISNTVLEEECLEKFRDILEDFGETDLDACEEELKIEANTIFENLKERNTVRKAEAEFHNAKITEDIMNELEEDVKAEYEETSFLEENKLAELISHISQAPESKFLESDKKGDSKFCAKFLEELKKKAQKLVEDTKLKNELRKKNAEGETNKIIESLVSKFESELSGNKLEETETLLNGDYTATFIQEFKEKCTIHSAMKEEKVDCLKQVLEATANKHKELIESKKKYMEQECRKARNNAFALYEKEMKNFLATANFYEIDVLLEKHEEIKIAARREFETCLSFQTAGDPEELETLENSLQVRLKEILEENQKNEETVDLKIQNHMIDSLKEYQEKIIPVVSSVTCEQALKEKHNEILTEVVDTFKSKLTHLCEPATMNRHVSALEAEAEKCYQEDALEIFNLKKDELEGSIENAVLEARKFYNEQMEKHMSNHKFIIPKKLEELHKQVMSDSIANCKSKMPIPEYQEDQLIATIEKAFEKFREQNDMNVPTEPAIGIDLGTTFSCVAVYMNGQVQVIPNKGKTTTPSYVAFTDAGEVMGEAAKDQAHANPENTIFDAKRIIGRGMNDKKLISDMKLWPFSVVKENDVPKVQVNGKTYFPEQISAKVLTEMKNAAEAFLNCEVKNAVITVPAYFNDGQRQATKDAGDIAGLNILTIINEPTAAAVAYKFQYGDEADNRNVLIYDLGGGTFDVAVLNISKGVIDVKSVDGDTHLGGEDFDNRLVEHCILEFQNKSGINLAAGKDSDNANERKKAHRILRRLRNECERQKVILSSAPSVNICVDAIYGEQDLKVHCSRTQFEEMNEVQFLNTMDIVDSCLASANMCVENIDEIVLVGGSTRIPKIQSMLSDHFNGKSLNKRVNPDEAVAIGAAMQAAIKNGQIAKESIDFTKIEDVAPLSLGVEVYGGGFSVIIPKNTKVPCKIKDQFKTAHNNQTSVQIVVYQGEQDRVEDNDMLGEFYLNGIPPADAGEELIDVELEMTDLGILHVCAVSSTTGKSGEMTIREHKKRLTGDAKRKLLAAA